MIQYRNYELMWIVFVYMFFKTNYIWILLWCVTFHVQVEIGLYAISTALESINRSFMRLWFYAAFIQIEFGSRVQSYVHLVVLEEKIALYLLTYGFNIKRKNIKEKKEVLEVLIHLS